MSQGTTSLNVINLFGSPGSGKSTVAAELFAKMKQRGYSVELITEFAKELVYEQRYDLLQQQHYVFAEQHRRQHRLIDQVDWAITDSPLLLSNIFASQQQPYNGYVGGLAKHCFDQFSNYNFVLHRDFDYFPTDGRVHDVDQSIRLHGEIVDMLKDNQIDYHVVETDQQPVYIILQTLQNSAH